MSTAQLRAVVHRMVALDPVMCGLVMDETPERPLMRPAPGHPPAGVFVFTWTTAGLYYNHIHRHLILLNKLCFCKIAL